MSAPILSRSGRQLLSYVLLVCFAGCAGAQTEPIPVRPLAPAWTAGSGRMEDLVFSPDGKSLAVRTSVGFRILDAKDGRVLNSVTRFPVGAPLSAVSLEMYSGICWSPDGKRIARAYDGVEIWDALGHEPERVFPRGHEDGTFTHPAWSPAGDLVAVANGGIVLLNVHSGARSVIPEPNDNYTNDHSVTHSQEGFSWSPDGRMLAVYVLRQEGTDSHGRTTVSESERIDLWDVSRLVLLRSIPLRGLQNFSHGSYQGIEAGLFTPDESTLAWSPDGKVLAVDSGRTGLSLWSFKSGKLLRQLKQGIRLISWSRNGATLHTRIDNEVRFIDPADGTTIYARRDDAESNSNRVSPDGRHFAAIINSEIYVWHGRREKPDVQIPWTGAVTFQPIPYAPSVSPNGHQLVMYVEHAVEIHDTESDQKLLGGLPAGVRISWSPNGEVIETAKWPEGHLVRMADGQQISSFLLSVGFAAFSPAGDLIAIPGYKSVQLIRTSDGSIAETIKKDVIDDHPEWNRHYSFVSWSPNGRKILLSDAGTGGTYLKPAVFSLENKTLELAPAGTGRLFWIGPEELVRASIPEGAVVQSPSRRIAAAIADGRGPWRFWDLRTSRMIAGLHADGPPYMGTVVWSQDSSRVAYLTSAGELDVWDVARGQIVERWEAPGSIGALTLVWPDKLTLMEELGGAVRAWRQPDQ